MPKTPDDVPDETEAERKEREANRGGRLGVDIRDLGYKDELGRRMTYEQLRDLQRRVAERRKQLGI